VNVSVVLVSAPIAPIRSSSACCVVAVPFDVGAVLVPVAVLVRSSTLPAAMPENSLTLTAFATTEVPLNETVTVLPLTSADVIGAEKTTVRTPAPEPLVPF